MPVVPLDRGLVFAAFELAERAQLSLWGAQIVAAASRAGCGRLLTEDLNAGQVIDGVTIVDPFADPGAERQ